jgi:hypothetical protein
MKGAMMNRTSFVRTWATRLAVLVALAPAAARGDGCFVWNKGADINEPSQKAIILYDAGREDLILQVKYEGPVDEFGWIIPVPGKPEVEKASMECFYELSRLVQAYNHRYRQGGDVKVIEVKTVGDYDIAVLSAADSKALAGWLDKHKFNWPKDRRDVLDHYVKKRWYFVAAKVSLPKAREDEDLARRLHTGELHPLKISFDSDECVYPLKISSINRGPSEIDVYVLAADRLACGDMDFFTESERLRPLKAANLPACGEDLPRLKGKTWRLVKHSRTFTPEVMQDLVFRPKDDKQWEAARLAYVRDYFRNRRKEFFAALAEYQRLLGRAYMNEWIGRGGSPSEDFNKALAYYIPMLGKAAPEMVDQFAMELLADEQIRLLHDLFSSPVDANVDTFAAALAKRIIAMKQGPDERPTRRRAYYGPDPRIRDSYVRLMLRLGPRASAGVKLLAEEFVKGSDAGLDWGFPVEPYSWGALLSTCPQEKAVDHLVEMMLKSPGDVRGAVRVFHALSSRKASRPLVAILNRSDTTVQLAAWVLQALAKCGADEEGLQDILKWQRKYPSQVTRVVGRIDAKLAYAMAFEFLEDDDTKLRMGGLDYLRLAKLDEAQYQAVTGKLLRMAGTAKDERLLFSIGEVLSCQVRPEDPRAQEVLQVLRGIRDTLRDTLRSNFEHRLRYFEGRLKGSTTTKPAE